MNHSHEWTYGSSIYDWQVCRECGSLKPENDSATPELPDGCI